MTDQMHEPDDLAVNGGPKAVQSLTAGEPKVWTEEECDHIALALNKVFTVVLGS